MDENTEETLDANEDKQPHPKGAAGTGFRYDGRGKVLVNRAVTLNRAALFLPRKRNAIVTIIVVNAPNLFEILSYTQQLEFEVNKRLLLL